MHVVHTSGVVYTVHTSGVVYTAEFMWPACGPALATPYPNKLCMASSQVSVVIEEATYVNTRKWPPIAAQCSSDLHACNIIEREIATLAINSLAMILKWAKRFLGIITIRSFYTSFLLYQD